MLFGLFFGDWTLLVVLPGLFFTLWAQFRVKSAFSKYSNIPSQSGLTGAEAARRLLDANGLYSVPVNCLSGGDDLQNFYDPRNRSLNLSNAVYHSRGIAAIGVACHEAGHAIQHANNYAPLSLRMKIIPLCNIGSNLAMPLFLLGLFFASALGDGLMLAGIALFGLSVLFQLVTLPVEFNASARAMEGMRENRLVASSDEERGARRVLSAAAMTYVAALAVALLSLLRLVLIARNSRR